MEKVKIQCTKCGYSAEADSEAAARAAVISHVAQRHNDHDPYSPFLDFIRIIRSDGTVADLRPAASATAAPIGADWATRIEERVAQAEKRVEEYIASIEAKLTAAVPH